MAKIKIKTITENKEGKSKYEGPAIKNKNTITYNDNGVVTKITIDDVITIERKKDYEIIIKLKKGIKLEGSYNTKYGKLKLEAKAKQIEKQENTTKIKYDLIINNKYVDTFMYYYEYSIDS